MTTTANRPLRSHARFLLPVACLATLCAAPLTRAYTDRSMSGVESPNGYSPGLPAVAQDGGGADFVVYHKRDQSSAAALTGSCRQ